jgi:plasmid stability protein
MERSLPPIPKARGALSAEFEARRVLEAALGANQRKWRGALAAKFHPTGIFKAAF